MTKNNDYLVWIDLEMTGLSPETNRIIEIATIITDAQLHIVATGPDIAILQDESFLSTMDEWNTKQHGQSGLLARVRQSTITETIAEQQTIAFLQQYLDPGHSPMCGNSICLDKRFLCRYMPQLANFFHYRQIDVSTVKELLHRWRPDLRHSFSKESQHRAQADIQDSIAELLYYKTYFFQT